MVANPHGDAVETRSASQPDSVLAIMSCLASVWATNSQDSAGKARPKCQTIHHSLYAWGSHAPSAGPVDLAWKAPSHAHAHAQAGQLTHADCIVQALYRLEVEVSVDGLGLSDSSSQRLGIRTVESVVDPELKGHVFIINGQRVGTTLSLTAAQGA